MFSGKTSNMLTILFKFADFQHKYQPTCVEKRRNSVATFISIKNTLTSLAQGIGISSKKKRRRKNECAAEGRCEQGEYVIIMLKIYLYETIACDWLRKGCQSWFREMR